MSGKQSHQSDNQNRICRNVHVEIGERMNEDRRQTDGASQYKCGSIARLGSQLAWFAADRLPGLENATQEQRKRGGNHREPDYAPISQGVQIIIMRVAGTQLHSSRAILGKAIIVVPRADTKPAVVLPHSQGRFPEYETGQHGVGRLA